MSIDILRKQRRYLKAKLTNINNFVSKAKRDVDTVPEEVTARLQATEEIYSYIKFQEVSQRLLIQNDKPDARDETEDSEFDERYYTIKAELLQLLERLKPPSAGPSSDSAGGSTSDATMKRFLEQQAILIQKLTERNDNEMLVRTMEQQGQLLEGLNTRSSTSVRETQVKLPLIKLPTFDGNVEEWKRYSDTFKNLIHDFNLNAYCLVVPNITKKLPSFTVEVSKLRSRIPDNLRLADPLYFNPGHIDALIGSEFFFQLLDNGKIELGDDLLALQNTKFGWIISGPVPQHLIVSRTPNRQSSSNHTCLLAQQSSIDETMKLFWELEEYKSKNTRLSKEEQCCEIHFVNTTTREASSGRFVVRLPFRENKQQLGRSRDIAMKRFNHLERKFQTNIQFRDEYVEFMREYIALGHMSVVDEDDSASNPIYLPHHGVIREASITTKLRVVFDASARTTSGFSLNDTLMIGSNLQDSIIDIVMRFRLPAIAITADL